MDDELKGEGNSANYKYRMHDPRIGRFFARDPLAHQYSYNSPYAFSENKVIHAIELEGLESVDVAGWFFGTANAEANHVVDVIQENAHVTLDILGCIPIIGEGFDIANGVIYQFEGNYKDAAISYAAIIPFAGDALKASKYFKYVVKFGSKVDEITQGSKVFKTAARAKQFTADAVKWGYKQASQYWDRGLLRKGLIAVGKGLSSTWQAHHIIPIAFVKHNKIVQKAIDQGFDMNDIFNGIALSTKRHNGSHFDYDQMVTTLLEKKMASGTYKNEKAALEATITELRRRITHDEHKGKTLNELARYYGYNKSGKLNLSDVSE
jgi:hypothetical protein